MFSRIAIIFTLFFFAMFAMATPINCPAGCTGSIQCCQSLDTSDNPAVKTIAGLLGVVLSPLDGLIGLTCNPSSVSSSGVTSCTATAVCCTGRILGGGALALGCLAVNLHV